jgi:hypothetical protein
MPDLLVSLSKVCSFKQLILPFQICHNQLEISKYLEQNYRPMENFFFVCLSFSTYSPFFLGASILEND